MKKNELQQATDAELNNKLEDAYQETLQPALSAGDREA